MLRQGRFIPRQPNKYAGNSQMIYYRSGWELACMKWFDQNNFIHKWSSEETVIPYICKTDGKTHRYFIDFKVTFTNGKTFVIEIKPERETIPPVKKPRQRQTTYLNEVTKYAKNTSKWEYAKSWADSKGYIFQVWTERHLKQLGIRLVGVKVKDA